MGLNYNIRMEKGENGASTIVDLFNTEDINSSPELITKTTVDPQTGITTIFTNNMKVMKEERTFQQCVDYLENAYKLSSNGFVIQSETIGRLQRSTEHHVRFVKGESAQDFRVNVDQRTGVVSLLEVYQHTVIPAQVFEVKPLTIAKADLSEASKQYSVIAASQAAVEQADYTFKGQQPDTIFITQYGTSVKLVIIYRIEGKAPSRVVLIGRRVDKTLQTGIQGTYNLQIVDLSPLAAKI